MTSPDELRRFLTRLVDIDNTARRQAEVAFDALLTQRDDVLATLVALLCTTVNTSSGRMFALSESEQHVAASLLKNMHAKVASSHSHSSQQALAALQHLLSGAFDADLIVIRAPRIMALLASTVAKLSRHVLDDPETRVHGHTMLSQYVRGAVHDGRPAAIAGFVMCCVEWRVGLPLHLFSQLLDWDAVVVLCNEALRTEANTQTAQSIRRSAMMVIAEILDPATLATSATEEREHRRVHGDAAGLTATVSARRIGEQFAEWVTSCQDRWLPFLNSACQLPVIPDDNTPSDDNETIAEALRVILGTLQGARNFSFALGSPHFFQALLQSIEVSSDVLRDTCCEDDISPDDDERVESDGLFLQLNKIQATRWECLAVVFRKKREAERVRCLFGGMLEPLARLLLEACLLPKRVAAIWERNTNVFLQHEQESEDGLSWLARDVATDMVRLVWSRFRGPWLAVLLRVCGEVLLNPETATDVRWREREAALHLLSVVVQSVPGADVEAAGGSITEVVHVLLQCDLCATSPQLLTARALLFVKMAGDHFSQHRRALADAFLIPSLSTLASFSVSASSVPPVTSVALSLLGRLCGWCSASSLTDSVVVTGLQALTAATTLPIEGEILYAVLDTLLVWIRKWRRRSASLRCADVFTQSSAFVHTQILAPLLQSWRRNLKDPNVGDVIVDLFSEVVSHGCDREGLLRELQWMSEAISGQATAETVCTIPCLVQMLKVTLEKAAIDVAAECANTLLQPLCQLMLVNDDSSIAASSADALGALLLRAGEAVDSMQLRITPSLVETVIREGTTPELPQVVSQARGMSPIAHLDEPAELLPLSDVLIAVVGSLLRPHRAETCLLHAGSFLAAVASKAHSFSPVHMQAFTTFILKRLLSTDTPVKLTCVSMELTQPLAVLLRQYPVPFLAVVRRMSLTTRLMEHWLDLLLRLARGTFPDAERLSPSIDALLELLLNHGSLPELDDIVVGWKDPNQPNGELTALPWNVATLVVLLKVALEVLRRPLEFLTSSTVGLAPRRARDSHQQVSGEDGMDDNDDDDDDDEEDAASSSDDDEGDAEGDGGRVGNGDMTSTPQLLMRLSRIRAVVHSLGGVQGLFSMQEQERLMLWLAA